MRMVQTSAGAVAYAETGPVDAPVVVVLHATLHDHRDFDPIVPALARHHRVIALDWPGHGASAPMPDATADRFAEVLAEVTQALRLGPAVYVGNSVGGYAAARLALDHPERVAGLVLVDTGGFTARTWVTRAYCRFFASAPVTRFLLPRIVRWYTRAVSDADHALVERATAATAAPGGRITYSSLWRSFNDPAYDLTARAGRITAPALLVWGRRDPVLPVRYGRVAQRLVPGSRLTVLNTGHLPFSSAPQLFLDAVEPFVREAHAATDLAGRAATTEGVKMH